MVLVMLCSSLCSEKWNLPGSVEGEWGWDDHGHGPGPGHGPGHGHSLGHAHHHRPPSLEKENSPGSVEGEAGVEGGPLHSDKTTLCNRPLLPGCTFDLYLYWWKCIAWNSTINWQSFEDAKIHFGNHTLEIKVWKLLPIAFRKYTTSCGPRMLCEAPETPTQWKKIVDFSLALTVLHWVWFPQQDQI